MPILKIPAQKTAALVILKLKGPILGFEFSDIFFGPPKTIALIVIACCNKNAVIYKKFNVIEIPKIHVNRSPPKYPYWQHY